MNDLDIIIDRVYSGSIDSVLQNVNPKYHQEIKDSYKQYLYNREFELSLGGDTIEEQIEFFTDFQNQNWKYYYENAKLSEILKDEAFDKIKEMSYESFKLASQKKMTNNPTISASDSATKIDMLRKLLNEVREFNKGFAEDMVSEAILDYNYASNNKEITSFRIAHL